MMSGEGYVKYTAEHTTVPAIEIPHWTELNDARIRLRNLNLIGSLPNGIGFGNLSIRTKENEFIISGTATGALPVLGPDGYCLVRSFDLNRNHVVSTGPVKASAESMSHGAVYRSCTGANCVIHIHSGKIFKGMVKNNFPATPVDAAFGTPEIALAIEKCVCALDSDEGCIVMLGHDEGVIAYGPSVERAFSLIQDLYNKYSKELVL